MKNILKKISIPLFFFFIWFMPIVDKEIIIESKQTIIGFILFVLAYSVAIVFLYIIKNKYIAVVLPVIIIAAVSCFYDRYLLFVFTPMLIMIDYVMLFKRHKKGMVKESANLGTNASAFLGMAVVIYELIKEGIPEKSHYLKTSSVIVGMGILLVMLAVVSIGKKTTVRKGKNAGDFKSVEIKTLKFIHIVNFICFAETVAFYFLQDRNNLFMTRIYFYPWLLYIGLMVICNDPILIELVYKAEEGFKKFAEKGEK